MTRFVDVPTLSTIVKTVGVSEFLAQLTEIVEEDFKRWLEFDKSARLASHSAIGVIELMPVSDGKLYSFKYVNGHPANTQKGLSTVMAFGALTEVETGYPLLLSEMTLSTALRTAATTVMASRLLARDDAGVMAMVGCGAQSEFQAIAFHSQLGINELRIYDTDSGAMRKLARNLQGWPGLRLLPMTSVAEAVSGADIVTTVTADKAWATILTPEMVAPGMHINGLGGDCPGKTEIHADLLTQSKIFVEYEPQTRVEGDIQQIPADYPVTELWQVLAGKRSGRENRQQITFFDSVGFALEDFSVLRYIYQLSSELGLGEDINLIPETGDPKNLFSLVGQGQPLSLPILVAS